MSRARPCNSACIAAVSLAQAAEVTVLPWHRVGLEQISLAGKEGSRRGHGFLLLELHRASVSVCSTGRCRGAGQHVSSQFKRVKVRHINFSPSVGIGKRQAVQHSHPPISDIDFSIG